VDFPATTFRSRRGNLDEVEHSCPSYMESICSDMHLQLRATARNVLSNVTFQSSHAALPYKKYFSPHHHLRSNSFHVRLNVCNRPVWVFLPMAAFCHKPPAGYLVGDHRIPSKSWFRTGHPSRRPSSHCRYDRQRAENICW
jgi:hypothetical protein